MFDDFKKGVYQGVGFLRPFLLVNLTLYLFTKVLGG